MLAQGKENNWLTPARKNVENVSRKPLAVVSPSKEDNVHTECQSNSINVDMQWPLDHMLPLEYQITVKDVRNKREMMKQDCPFNWSAFKDMNLSVKEPEFSMLPPSIESLDQMPEIEIPVEYD